MRWHAVLLILCGACSGRTDDTADASSTAGSGGLPAQDASLDACAGNGGCGATAGSGGATGSGGQGGMGGTGGSGGGGGFAGSIIIDDFWPPPVDINCIETCHPIGGQYCGRIGDPCSHPFECGLSCDTPGFTCGGAGLPNVCGAPLDSGVCTPTNCAPDGGKYCGYIGDGCGGSVDCGGCPAGQTCGGRGSANICGVSGEGGALPPPPPPPAPPPPPPPN